MNNQSYVRKEKQIRSVNTYRCENGCNYSEISIIATTPFNRGRAELIYNQCLNLKCRRCNGEMFFSHGDYKEV